MAASISFCCLNSSFNSHDLSPSLCQSNLQRTRSFRCYSSTRDRSQTPRLLKIAVNGVTEILRLFSSAKERSDGMKYTEIDEPSISGIDDVMVVLKSDYDSAYFVTGNFTPTIYAEDCIFEDPTIKFRGKDLYSRNLKLLVPFFDGPSIVLQKIEKGMNSQTNFVLATWELRTYLKLPWRPLISIEGSTVYDLGDEFKIVRHAERWNVSALEAVAQIFTPSFERIGE
ncbi:uncharacterized protein LOC122091297 [Macadamia integrifolia]|uniref:uncharacterized protein LOC122091297 n=1 Tax=Macadamia integrifolia TaxID=60698 RepID=UPI001C4FB021|nr:uncharacterized protein LOC122091297 [Macadamia integrifolia]